MGRVEMRDPENGNLGSVLGWDEDGNPLFCLVLPEVEFAEWMSQVEYSLGRKTGGVIGSTDLPDWNYHDAYADGMRPKDAAAQVLEENGWERVTALNHWAPIE